MTPGEHAQAYEVALRLPTVPEDLQPPAGDSGQVIALLADEASRAHGWSGRFALALAARWSSLERRVVLVDADVAAGSLHEVAGVPNNEGVGDLLRYGASSTRVTRKLSAIGPSLIPSGTVVSDPEEALCDSRWALLLDEFRSAAATLLLYLPAGSSGAAALADDADGVIRMVFGPPEGELAPGAVWIHAFDVELSPEISSSARPAEADAKSLPPLLPQKPPPKRRRRRFGAIVVTLLILLAVTYILAGPG